MYIQWLQKESGPSFKMLYNLMKTVQLVLSSTLTYVFVVTISCLPSSMGQFYTPSIILYPIIIKLAQLSSTYSSSNIKLWTLYYIVFTGRVGMVCSLIAHSMCINTEWFLNDHTTVYTFTQSTCTLRHIKRFCIGVQGIILISDQTMSLSEHIIIRNL